MDEFHRSLEYNFEEKLRYQEQTNFSLQCEVFHLLERSLCFDHF